MLPSTLAEELIIHGDRPSSRLKHGLIAPRFSSKYVQNSISYRGAVPWNVIGRSNRSILECTDLKSFLKNVVNCHTFKDFNFNVLTPQITNKRSEDLIYYIKVSGIRSGNKFVKTIHVKIWYPHKWRYRWFHWYQVCLLNCTLIRWCIIETSSDLPRKSSAVFGNSRRYSENVRAFGTILENFRKSSESGRKSSENHQKRRVYIIKRTLHVGSRIWILFSRSRGKNIKFISSRHRVIFAIYYIDESVLLGTKPLVDLIRHFIRDPSGAFSVCHLCECHIVQWHQVCLLNCT